MALVGSGLRICRCHHAAVADQLEESPGRQDDGGRGGQALRKVATAQLSASSSEEIVTTCEVSPTTVSIIDVLTYNMARARAWA
jgi:hypothetical protein